MITKTVEGKKALQIFESFQIDRLLPKHAVKAAAVSQYTVDSSGNQIGWGGSGISFSPDTVPFTGITINGKPLQTTGWLARAIAALFNKAKSTYVESRKVPVEQIFEAILGKGRKLEVLEGRLETHRAAIEKAKSMGQQALVDQLTDRTAMVEMEAVLFAAGHREFIDENQLIDFAEKCEKGLRLDWIKNFVRLIPHDIEIKKVKMDALQVFDNYAILSYDPHNKNSTLTKKEVEKKKDPILFGLIKGSRRLYHVGSWKDEYCDLTFGDLIDKYGKDILTLK